MADDESYPRTEGDAEMQATPTDSVVRGDGYAVAHLDVLGEGPGFRKVRQGLGVEAFGVNAIVMPPGYASTRHYHDEQQELYFIYQGTIEFSFQDGSSHLLGPGSLARVDARTVRSLRNVSEVDATYLCVGGKDGYVGRDGRLPEGESGGHGASSE